MAALKVLIVCGSLRTASLNAQLAAAVMKELVRNHADVTLISLADYPLPIFDADGETRSGVPRAAQDLKRMIGSHEGIFIASPEYNASLTPLIKNMIDWVSHVQERGEGVGEVFRARVFALGAASPRRLGGALGLIALRHVLTLGCGATVLPEQLSIAAAHEAFDESGRLKHLSDADALRTLVRKLIAAAGQTR